MDRLDHEQNLAFFVQIAERATRRTLLGCVYILPALNQNRSKIDKTEIPNR